LLACSAFGVAYGVDQFGRQIRAAGGKVEHFAGEGISKESVDSEVPAQGVFAEEL